MMWVKFFPIALSFFMTTWTAFPINSQEDVDQSMDTSMQPRGVAGGGKLADFWQSLKTFVHEKKLFIAEFWHNRRQVGSLTPSSKYLALSMTKNIKNSDRQTPLTILEVGAGTGIFTKYIIKRMPEGSDFDVVEIDPLFCDLLTKNMTKEFGQIPNVHFLCCDITTLVTGKQYDFIISGLPFHSFEPALVSQILEMYVSLIKPGGTVTFFEYLAIQTLRKPFLTDEEQDALETIRDLIKIFKNLGKSTSESIVWRNFLPARVISVKF
jgi:phosphatidylethanolamine/phosphatidyl-N-methylethanolamine N-methyltransferase